MAENEMVITEIPIAEELQDTEVEEVTQVIEVEETETVSVEVDEVVVSLGDDGNQFNHALLNNRELPNQHPITAIEGLRQELDKIEALQTVYSDKKQQADYYKWYDENLLLENRDGFFVTIYPETNHIQICNEDSDVFGVTVAEAGFIGGQEYIQAEDGTKIGKNRKYGLVVYSGIVGVRCETTVSVGDYVVPNNRGEAKKSEGAYGYLVTALSQASSIQYAIISLSTPSTLTQKTSDSVQNLSGRMDNVETDIISVMGVANSAYAHADKLMKDFEDNVIVVDDKINGITDNLNDINGRVDTLNSSSTTHSIDIAKLKQEVTDLDVYAQSVQTNANTRADELSTQVNDIINKLSPISEWTDDETQNSGERYLRQCMEDGIATSWDIEACQTKDEELATVIKKSAKGIQTLAQRMSYYTVGEYSQAYGLTLKQAQSILSNDKIIIYIPTVSHDETYHDSYTQTFTKTFAYTWNGELWEESNGNIVTLSDTPVGSDGSYWVVDSDNNVIIDGVTYKKDYLYFHEDGEWIEKASVEKNSLSRAVSIIHQAANELAFEVTNARGDAATISARLDSEGAKTSMVASVVTDIELTEPAGIYNTLEELEAAEVLNDGAYYCVKENVPFDVYKWNAKQNKFIKQESIRYDGINYCKINTASIIGAVNNEGDSLILLNADKINFKGMATFFSTDENGGITAINGDGITTGTISAERLDLSGVLSVSEKADLVSVVEIFYARSSSATEFMATTNWTLMAPMWVEGEYMWQKTKTTYADGNIKESSPICIQGAKGSDGKSVNIKGIAYTQQDISDNTIGISTYTIYSDMLYQTQIINPADSDAYLIEGYLLVYSGAENYFTCVGKIQGPAGETPTISISEDGYWVINEVKQSVKAEGNDGIYIEVVIEQYYLSTSVAEPKDGEWVDIVDNSTLPIEKDKYRFRRQKYIWSNDVTTYSAARLDEIDKRVLEWCNKTDTTFIEGSKIYTRSITSDQLNTNAIHSIEYNSGVDNSLIPNGHYSNRGTFLNLSDGSIYAPNFGVDSNGIIHAKNANIEGDINATRGTIGGCEIVDGQLTAPNLSVISANMGDITAGVIHSKDYNASTNTGAAIFFNENDGLAIQFPDFKVDSGGNIIANSGLIGNCTIKDGEIISANNNFRVDAKGNLYANSGEIGGNLQLTSSFKIGINENEFIQGRVFTGDPGYVGIKAQELLGVSDYTSSIELRGKQFSLYESRHSSKLTISPDFSTVGFNIKAHYGAVPILTAPITINGATITNTKITIDNNIVPTLLNNDNDIAFYVFYSNGITQVDTWYDVGSLSNLGFSEIYGAIGSIFVNSSTNASSAPTNFYPAFRVNNNVLQVSVRDYNNNLNKICIFIWGKKA